MHRKACSVYNKNALGCHGKFATRGLLLFFHGSIVKRAFFFNLFFLGLPGHATSQFTTFD